MTFLSNRAPVHPAGLRAIHLQAPVIILAGVSAATLFGLDLHAVPGLALPVFGVLALSTGGLIAAYAWLRGITRGDGLSMWDVAGIFLFLGFAALIVGQPEQALRFTGG